MEERFPGNRYLCVRHIGGGGETTGARVKAFSVLSPSFSAECSRGASSKVIKFGLGLPPILGGEMGFRDTPSAPPQCSSLLPAGKVYRAKGGGT